MKSLADFKRTLKDHDGKWEIFNSFKNETRVTHVAIVQSKSFAMATESGVASWLDFPKASQCVFINNHDGCPSVRINLNDVHYIIYKPLVGF